MKPKRWWRTGPRKGCPGTRIKYPVQDLAVGEHVLIPWKKDRKGEPLSSKKQSVMGNAVRNYARRTGKRFYLEGTAAGLSVTRTA